MKRLLHRNDSLHLSPVSGSLWRDDCVLVRLRVCVRASRYLSAVFPTGPGVWERGIIRNCGIVALSGCGETIFALSWAHYFSRMTSRSRA